MEGRAPCRRKPSLSLFGQSAFTLGFTLVLLDAVAALLVFALGRRLFSRSVGVGAALLFWIWPESTLFGSRRSSTGSASPRSTQGLASP